VILTADIGPAAAVLGAGHTTDSRWEETQSGLAVSTEVLRSIQDRFQVALPVTWFIRADRLILQQFGDRLAIFDMFADFTQQALKDGHEVGWLPQVYGGGDAGISYEDLSTTHGALTRAALAPRSVRMGNCFHDNRTMAILDELGVRSDSSAIPGRTKDDLGWRMDWTGTPAAPYHPAVADYRAPGAPQLGILEVPLTVRPLKAPYDQAPLLRYVNPCMHREFFGQNLGEIIESRSYLLCIFHPDEAVPPRSGNGHPLVAYAKEELAFNLAQLFALADSAGRAVTFHTLESFSRTAVADASCR
jgi:hypothetical protein